MDNGGNLHTPSPVEKKLLEMQETAVLDLSGIGGLPSPWCLDLNPQVYIDPQK